MKKLIFMLLLGTLMFSQSYSKPDYGSGTPAQTITLADLGTQIQAVTDVLTVVMVPIQESQVNVTVATTHFYDIFTIPVSHAIYKEEDVAIAFEKSILRLPTGKNYFALANQRYNFSRCTTHYLYSTDRIKLC